MMMLRLILETNFNALSDVNNNKGSVKQYNGIIIALIFQFLLNDYFT